MESPSPPQSSLLEEKSIDQKALEEGLDEQPEPLNDERSVDDGLNEKQEEVEDESKYASGMTLNLIVIGLTLSILLVALDNAILATAIPTITTAFNSLQDVGWYGSSFLITICALQPLSGKLYQHFSLKWTYLSFLAVFELGSLICGVAQSSTMLIVGRAVAGMGAAGLFSGALTIISHTIPLRLRPVYIGIVAASMQIASVVGPLIGGALTQHASWRWCFYINLPAGAVTALLLVIFFHPGKRDKSNLSVWEKIQKLDLPGFFLFGPAVIMLLLAIQWGGSLYSWNSATIIGLICGAVGVIAVFVVWQWHKQEDASIPPRIFLNRNILVACTVSFFMFGCFQLAAYYLPIWFQVIKGADPTNSGVMFLPVVISSMLFTFIAGGLVTKLGYFNPWMIFGTAMISIGGGILSLLNVNSGSPQWIGYQVILGAGVGSALPMALIAVMAVVPQNDISVANGVVVFFQFLGGGVCLAVAENIFTTQLLKYLAINAPNVNAQAVIDAGAAAVATVVSPENLHAVLVSYNSAIIAAFYMIATAGAIAFVGSFGMQWVSVKGKSLVGGAV